MALLFDHEHVSPDLYDPRFARELLLPAGHAIPNHASIRAFATRRHVKVSQKDEDRVIRALYHARTYSDLNTLEVSSSPELSQTELMGIDTDRR